jgi:hypothetical protein
MARRKSVMEALATPLFVLMVAFLGYKMLQPKLQARLTPRIAARDTIFSARTRLLAMDAGQVERLRAQAAQDHAAVDAFEQQLPVVDGTPALLATLQSQAEALGVSLGDLMPLPQPPPGTPVVTPYGSTTYVLLARGGWEPMLGLIRHLGTTNELVVPRMDVLRADTTGSVLDAKIFLTVVSRTSLVPDSATTKVGGTSTTGNK